MTLYLLFRLKRTWDLTKGNNLGVQFLQKNFDCDYLLFTNTDIEIKSKNIISKMIACLEGDKERGADWSYGIEQRWVYSITTL